MKADERYFMAMVSLRGVQRRIERVIQDVEEHRLVPSIELMAACIDELARAMIQTHRDRLSDPRYRPPNPGCEAGCGQEGAYRVCHSHSVDVPYRDKP